MCPDEDYFAGLAARRAALTETEPVDSEEV
jgi:hypothetical protein